MIQPGQWKDNYFSEWFPEREYAGGSKSDIVAPKPKPSFDEGKFSREKFIEWQPSEKDDWYTRFQGSPRPDVVAPKPTRPGPLDGGATTFVQSGTGGPQDDWYTRFQGSPRPDGDEVGPYFNDAGGLPEILTKQASGSRLVGGGSYRPSPFRPEPKDIFPGFQLPKDSGGHLTRRAGIEIRKRRGALESQLDKGPGFGEFDAPEYDRKRVSALAQKHGAPDRRLLRENISQVMAQDFENPNVRRTVLRDALTGYGRGLGQLSQAAYASAVKEYQGEYDRQWKETHANWLAEQEKAKAEYQRIWDEYESLGGRSGTSIKSIEDMRDPNIANL